MGCPSEVIVGDNLVFSICTHDPDTGELTDADEGTAYRVYEEETATAILNGTMAKLDDANTTGFYTELLECTAANGFEDGKSYTIYVQATVDSATGGISYGFRAEGARAEPGQGAPPATATTATKVDYLYKNWRNKKTEDATTFSLYADDGTTVDQEATVSDTDGTVTKGEIGTGA